MELLENRIRKDGRIGAGNVLKVDSFLNHQIDVPFLSLLGEEFYRLYKDSGVTKILTIEASGIGVACLTAAHFGVPVVFAKKTHTNNIYADVYTSSVYSYTHQRSYDIVVSKQFLSPGDRVLIIDDFLAKGSALLALLSLIKDAGAEVVGAGIVIEKAYQNGGQIVREMGIRVESLARVASMTEAEGVRFC
ncbi:MAG: xanthine phosphoribosyltransferase [Clostridia bacterium]|nr:xanthine phosphoribosyltransferase [Clostridia bacterium]